MLDLGLGATHPSRFRFATPRVDGALLRVYAVRVPPSLVPPAHGGSGASISAISVDRLTKRYGVHAAVDSISFHVDRGEVVGFLGPNGAGKSTTLRILAGFLGATSGRAMIDGHDVALEPDRAR